MYTSLYIHTAYIHNVCVYKCIQHKTLNTCFYCWTYERKKNHQQQQISRPVISTQKIAMTCFYFEILFFWNFIECKANFNKKIICVELIKILSNWNGN